MFLDDKMQTLAFQYIQHVLNSCLMKNKGFFLQQNSSFVLQVVQNELPLPSAGFLNVNVKRYVRKELLKKLLNLKISVFHF